jgi:uncharacterized protein
LSTNEQFAEVFKSRPDKYPLLLEKGFPRIFSKIAAIWGTDKANEYFIELLVDKRGTRKGFPQKIAEEIFFLSELHTLLYHGQSLSGGQVWNDSQRITQAETKTREFREALEARSIKFIAPEFFARISRGDMSAVVLFVNAGMDIDTPNEQGWTPLMVALFEGREDVALFLIKKGANVNFSDRSGYRPVHWAAFKAYTTVINEIVARNGDVNAETDYGWTALLQAASLGHVATVEALLRHGARPNAKDKEGAAAIHKAASNDHADLTRALVRGGAARDLEGADRSTALHIAARLGHDDTVEALLEIGCSQAVKDTRGATPLHLAAAGNHIVVLEQLITLKPAISPRDKDGATPLVYAVRAGAIEAARRLNRAGAPIQETIGNDVPETATPAANGLGRMLVGAAGALKVFDQVSRTSGKLQRLIERNDVEGVKRIIDKIVDVNARDAEGRTPLEHAAIRDHDQIWWLLVERGAGKSNDRAT